MKTDIKNANSKIIGYINIEEDKISIHNGAYRKYLKNHPEIIQQYDIRFKKAL